MFSLLKMTIKGSNIIFLLQKAAVRRKTRLLKDFNPEITKKNLPAEMFKANEGAQGDFRLSN